MYATKAMNSSPADERNCQIALSICKNNWDLAKSLWELLNQLTGNRPWSLDNARDMVWLMAIDRVFEGQVQNA